MPLASGHDYANYYPRRVNAYVGNLVYAADVTADGVARMELGQPAAAAANNIMNAVDITNVITKGGAVAGTFRPNTMMGRYGRNVQVTLGAAGTPNVTVYGRDYLGQPMSELIAATGATASPGKKAFYSVDNVTTSAGVATTLSLGGGNVLGLPYATVKINEEYVDDVAPTAGAVVLAQGTQTATSTDPRGTYAPHSSVLPNGSRNIVVIGRVLAGNLHGVRQYST
jgi:hypothetical protein